MYGSRRGLPNLRDSHFITIANDRRWLAASFRDSLRFYDLTAGSEPYAELSGRRAFDDAIVSPDGRVVVAAVADAGYINFTHEVWDVAARKVRITLDGNGATRDTFSHLYFSRKSRGSSPSLGHLDSQASEEVAALMMERFTAASAATKVAAYLNAR